MAHIAFTDDEPPAPRPRTYRPSAWPAPRVAINPGQIRPGSPTARRKFGERSPAGASADRWSGPASSSSTDVPGRSDRRAASTAPAEPAPTTTRRRPGVRPADRHEPALGGTALDLGDALIPGVRHGPGAAAALLPDAAEEDRLRPARPAGPRGCAPRPGRRRGTRGRSRRSAGPQALPPADGTRGRLRSAYHHAGDWRATRVERVPTLGGKRDAKAIGHAPACAPEAIVEVPPARAVGTSGREGAETPPEVGLNLDQLAGRG